MVLENTFSVEKSGIFREYFSSVELLDVFSTSISKLSFGGLLIFFIKQSMTIFFSSPYLPDREGKLDDDHEHSAIHQDRNS